jgi:hypothetical protein
VLAAALLFAAPSASAEVTIGSDLQPSPGNADPCVPDDDCTVANSLLPGAQLSSPMDGVLVRWRVRAQATAGEPVELRLRVIRAALGGVGTGVSSSATRTIPASGLETFSFATRQRIESGDQVALDIEPPNNELLIVATAVSGPTFDRWQPVLGDGEARGADDPGQEGEVTLNADVEADIDGDGFGDETQDDCPTAPGSRHGCETVPPETTIVKGPKGKLKTRKRKKKVRFKFVSSEPGSKFRCVVDDGLAEACHSPIKHRFRRGRHGFEVQAIDSAGNADPTPATLAFKLKRKHKRKKKR